MLRVKPRSSKWWPERAREALISALSLFVFAFLDLLDVALCPFYRFIDGILEENPVPCYCWNGGQQSSSDGDGGEEDELSETLHARKNLFRELCSLPYRGKMDGEGEGSGRLWSPRWSDCGCRSCSSWAVKGGEKLHLAVREPSDASREGGKQKPLESVIFLHGFLSSSSFWAENVFPNFSEASQPYLRVFAVDLLGFGKSPKPMDCLYRLKEHIEMIENSVIKPYHLESFHLVAHSMGCIIALALTAKYPKYVISVTLVAPPYFPSTKERASNIALNQLAGRRIWPPLLLGSAVMSWYEHLGRTVCFLYCKNHRIWEWILKFMTRRRDLSFMITDITKHTHHSAWHTMHNVICGGAKILEKCLETVKREGIAVKIIHGDKDQVVPLECSYNLKVKVPLAEVEIIANADHNTVLLGREKAFTRNLEEFWFSSAEFEKDKSSTQTC